MVKNRENRKRSQIKYSYSREKSRANLLLFSKFGAA